MKWNILLLFVLSLAGCASSVRTSATTLAVQRNATFLLPLYENATVNENAGVALTELTSTALMQRGFSVRQLERRDSLLLDPTAAPGLADYRAQARKRGADYLLLGTVHEYDFKTDLDGSPAVGITIKIVDPRTGNTVAQGSSGNVGHFSSSLTTTAQGAVEDLLSKIVQTN